MITWGEIGRDGTEKGRDRGGGRGGRWKEADRWRVKKQRGETERKKQIGRGRVGVKQAKEERQLGKDRTDRQKGVNIGWMDKV